MVDVSKKACDERIDFNGGADVIHKAEQAFKEFLEQWVPELEKVNAKVNLHFEPETRNEVCDLGTIEVPPHYKLVFTRPTLSGTTYSHNTYLYPEQMGKDEDDTITFS